MNPAAIAAVISLVEEAVTQAPAIAAEFRKIFSSGTPTAADFAALRAKVVGESYNQFVAGPGAAPS